MSRNNGVVGKLVDDMRRATAAVQESISDVIDEVGPIMLEVTQENTPVKKGVLKASEKLRRYKLASGKEGVEVTARTPYAHIIEKDQHFLERSHAEAAKRAAALSGPKVQEALERVKVE